MNKEKKRPSNLPDFRNPPLNEVVLGVQFMQPRGYQQIRAGQVWDIFRPKFPLVEEHPPLAPVFETFGLSSFAPQFQFGMIPALHNRYWFLAQEKEQLIQFQQDRLLHNWRKVGDRSNEYPRFEAMMSCFESEMDSLETFFDSIEPQQLLCNQAEISYINHIMPNSLESNLVEDWVRFVSFGSSQPDSISLSTREDIVDDNGLPFARLHCDFTTATNPAGGKMLVLSLTVRGAPKDTKIASSLDFLKLGRDLIVKKFAAITTDRAHLIWERLQ